METAKRKLSKTVGFDALDVASTSYPKLGALIWFRHGKFGPKRQLKQNNLADPNPDRFRPKG